MTASTATELTALVRRARVLLLDFDGPICAIFAGHPAPLVAQELAQALANDGAPVPAQVRDASDPFEVLRFAATLGNAAATRTEARLRSAEIAAIPTAKPTPHTAALIEAWRSSGRPVAAVSNNSEVAVISYAERHQLDLDPIVGRTSPDPSLLKPSPYLIHRVLEALGATARDALLVGDSPSDMRAGNRAGVATIGYANKPGKKARLAAGGAHVVVDDMAHLSRAVVTQSR